MTELNLIPNWSTGVRETYVFLTEVFRSRSGKEQRVALRDRPRMSIAFDALLRGPRMRKFAFDKLVAAEEPVTIGRFGSPQYLVISASSTTMFLESVSAPPTGNYLIYGGGNIEYFNVTSVAAVDPWSSGFDLGFGPTPWSLTLSAPLDLVWDGGIVVPTVQGHLGQSSAMQAVTDDLVSLPVNFRLLPGAYAAPYGSLVYDLLDDKPVMDVPPNWAAAVSPSIEFPYEEVDFTVGRIQDYAPVDFVTRLITFSTLSGSRADTDRLIGHFCRMRGRAGEFYCPTWTSDLIPLSGAASGSDVIYVLGDSVFEDTVHKAIYIRRSDGSAIPMRVTAIDDASGGSGGFSAGFDAGFSGGFNAFIPPEGSKRLTLAEPFPSDLPIHDITMICWMPVCRFASDELVVTRITDEIAQVTVNVMSLEYL